MKRITGVFLLVGLLLSCSMAGSDGNDAKVENIFFPNDKISLAVGETVSIGVSVTPADLAASAKVAYSLSAEGVVSLSDGTANGVVATGLRAGSVVIIVTGEGFTDYCEVTVTGKINLDTPYIITPTQVVELAAGAKRSISVSLYGGTPADNSKFSWAISNPNIASIQAVGNVVVIEAIASGSAKIQIEHPNALYTAEIIVFVLEENKDPVYITTSNNVVIAPLNGVNKLIDVSLIGGEPTDSSAFTYEIVEGQEVINIIGVNNTCNITTKAKGTAVLRIKHPKAEYALDIIIVVTSTVDEAYIEVSQSLVVISGNQSSTVTATFIGDVSNSAFYHYGYELTTDNVVHIVQSNNEFFITPIKPGSTKLIIKNSDIKYEREVLVIVQNQDDNVVSNETYITTSQNIIQTEVGASPTTLSMVLVGGNEADKNSFAWDIEDSNIIDVQTPDGTVNNNNIRGSVRASTVIKDTYNTKAIITPEAVGTSTITVRHPKASAPSVVLVKVYPRGTFETTPIVLSSDNSLRKVVVGSTSSINLTLASGSSEDLGDLTWSTQETAISTVVGAGLNGQLSGIATGITDLTVSGDNLFSPYKAKVLVGTESELANTKVIYVDNPYQIVASGQTVYIEIRSNNDLLKNSGTFYANSNDADIAYVRMINNILVIQGVSNGTVDIEVGNSSAVNTITMQVTVEPQSVDINYPYYLRGNSFEGVVNGQSATISVALVGADAGQESAISWQVEDDSILSVYGNGKNANITGKKLGQTRIKVTHIKAYYPLYIVAYVVATEAEIGTKIVLSLDANNYLLNIGSSKFIKVTTNATGTDIQGITWSVDDVSVVNVDENYDSAYIQGKNAGNAKITVSHPRAVKPLIIYVSVSDTVGTPDGKQIGLPSIIEMKTGTNKVINASLSGFSTSEANAIQWSAEDTTIASVSGTGGTAYVFAKKAGQTYINVTHSLSGTSKRVLLVSVDSLGDIDDIYVMAVDSTYLKLEKGDKRTIPLIFGSAGFPEAEKQNVSWSCTANDVITLAGNGSKADILAKNVGLTSVTVTSPIVASPLTFMVEVADRDAPTEGFYNIVIDNFAGVVLGESKTITAKVYDSSGRQVTSGLGALTWTVDNPSIADITANGDACMISAKALGQTYINIEHPKLKEPVRVLVYTANTAADLSKSFPLYADTNNYMIKVGETIRLRVSTINDVQSNLDGIKWSVANTAYVKYSSISKKEMDITGKAVGNSVITITHPNSSPVNIYVTVKAAESENTTKAIVTEGIIGIVKGSSRDTTVTSNLTASEISALTWTSDNTSIVTVSGTGASATLNAINTGETYVTVKSDNYLKRKILVYVTNTSGELDSYYAMNIDKQNYKLGIGGQLSLNALFAPNTPSNKNMTTWEDVYGNNVVKFTSSAGNATVTGLNEGIAVLKISHPACITPIYVYIEVSKYYSGEVIDDSSLRYITANKTLYVLDPSSTTTPTTITVSAVGLTGSEIAQLEWSNSDSTVFTHYANRAECIVYPNKEGRATLTVSHPKSQNMLTITIVVGPKDTVVNPDVPYVYAGTTVASLNVLESKNLEFSLKNVAYTDNTKFVAAIDNSDVAAISTTGNVVKITGKKSGQALLRVSHPSASYNASVVIVVKNGEDSLVYLTTENNYNIVALGAYATLKAQLVGYNETNASNFTWKSLDENIVTVSGNGSSIVATGRSIGTARIEVSHTYSMYSLYMYVRVTQVANTKPVYISTPNNIVTVVKGNSTTLKVELMNGATSENSLFQWSTPNNDVINLLGSGSSALIQGLKEGVATITVAHPSSMNTINIIALVENSSASDDIYITTESALVEMKPTDASRNIAVKLIGGTPSDIYGFVWNIQDYVSTIKYADGTNKEVIKVVSSADSAYILPKNEGEATIRVTHPKTNYKLDIKVKVSLYSSVKFGSPSLEMEQNTTKSVSIEAPTGATVVYESSNPSVCSVTGTNKMCIIEGLNPGIAVITARTAAGDSSDEIIVNVKKGTAQDVNYITCSANILTMNLNQAPVTLTGAVVGTIFSDADNDSIVWTSQDTAVVTTYGVGKTCKITPKTVGSTTITLTHTKIPAYQKRIYVQVEANEASFTISDAVKLMTEGDQATISVLITNVSDLDYNTDVVWQTSDASIATAMKAGDGSKCILVAKKAGSANVTATFGSLVKTCTVLVSEPRTLTLQSTAELVPNETIYLPYQVTPDGTSVTYQIDTTAYTIIVHEPDNKRFVVTGKNKAGYTTLTATANGITTSCVINTNYNYYFNLAKPSVRGVPSGTYVVNYNVSPAKDTIQLGAYDTSVCDVLIDKNAQTITVTAKKAGYTELPMTASSNGSQITLPIYLYYETLPATWNSSASRYYADSRVLHSKVDETQAAIYLADGENIDLTPVVNATTYPTNGLRITGVTLESANNSAVSVGIYPNHADSGTPGRARISASSPNYFGNPSEVLYSTAYVGKIVISYAYFSGGTTPQVYKKMYMLYSEVWRRR